MSRGFSFDLAPVVYLLSAAAALAFYFGELEEGAAIAIVLGLNALIGIAPRGRVRRNDRRTARGLSITMKS